MMRIATCQMCGNQFETTAGNVKFCPACRKHIKVCKNCGTPSVCKNGFCSETCRLNYQYKIKQGKSNLDKTLEICQNLGIDYKTYAYYRDVLHWNEKKIINHFKED